MILGSGLLTASGKTRLTLYTTKSGTFSPTIVASDTSGIVWDFGDGSATYTGGTPSHSYADSSQKTVRITFGDPSLVTQLNFHLQSMTGEWPLSSLADFTSLKNFSVYLNSALNVTGTLSEAPNALVSFEVFNTSSTVTGSLADLPPALVSLRTFATLCAITGNLSDAPSPMTTLQLGATPSNIGGGGTAISAAGLYQINLDTGSTSQANVDDILLRLYTDRAIFTNAAPTINVGGSNPNPSGVYQDATPPTTGLEYAYKLVNDPDSEGFNTWTVTY